MFNSIMLWVEIALDFFTSMQGVFFFLTAFFVVVCAAIPREMSHGKLLMGFIASFFGLILLNIFMVTPNVTDEAWKTLRRGDLVQTMDGTYFVITSIDMESKKVSGYRLEWLGDEVNRVRPMIRSIDRNLGEQFAQAIK